MGESRFRLVDEEVEYLQSRDQGGMLSQFFSNTYQSLKNKQSVYYSFDVPASFYLRGELLCEEVSEVIEETFTHADLIGMLFDDFLRDIKSYDFPFVYKSLIERDRRPSYIAIHTLNGTDQVSRRDMNDKVRISCYIKRKLALKAEVFLSDLADIFVDVTFSIKEVLQILYCDFILAYKNGEMKNVIKKIVNSIDEE